MLRLAESLSAVSETILVSYEEKEKDVFFLPDCWTKLKEEGFVLILSWGGSVNPIFERYGDKLPMIYFMKGQDFGDQPPIHVPVISNCQYLLAKAQQEWPLNLQLYLPELIEDSCSFKPGDRDIDVLIHARKQSPYILNTLVPALIEEGLQVQVQEAYISADEMYTLYNRAKVYLYAFEPMRTDHHPDGYRWMEGSATQTLEAMACGCQLMTNFRGGMVDFIEPPLIGRKITCFSPEWDVHQVKKTLSLFDEKVAREQSQRIHERYGKEKYQHRLQSIHAYLNDYFQFMDANQPNPDAFQLPRPLRSWDQFKNRLYRLKKKISR